MVYMAMRVVFCVAAFKCPNMILTFDRLMHELRYIHIVWTPCSFFGCALNGSSEMGCYANQMASMYAYIRDHQRFAQKRKCLLMSVNGSNRP